MIVGNNKRIKEIEKVCAEMVRAWYDGDPDLMQDVLHDDLAKRGVLSDPESGHTVIGNATKTQMVEAAREGIGKIPKKSWAIDVTVLDASEKMATVRVKSAYLVDICQVVNTEKGWKIINVLWTAWRTPPWFNRERSQAGCCQ